MKLKLNPIIDKISGKLQNLIFISPKKGLGSFQSYVRTPPKPRNSLSIKQINSSKAFKIIVQKYHELKSDLTAYQTWKTASDNLRQTENRYWTVYKLFMSIYMKKYTQNIGLPTEPIDLSSGSSLDYEHRNTRIWNPTTGYGKGTFGTGTYNT